VPTSVGFSENDSEDDTLGNLDELTEEGVVLGAVGHHQRAILDDAALELRVPIAWNDTQHQCAGGWAQTRPPSSSTR
jgi:hypothetical protein